MQLNPIGLIRTPFLQLEDMPIQPAGAQGARGRIELNPELAAGLKDLAGFSHIIVLYQFHLVTSVRLRVIPFLDNQPRGVFATRAPTRPNPIGLSVLALKEVKGAVLTVEDVDMLDGSPLLDIKPYVAEFDRPIETRSGWLENASGQVKTHRSDRRFIPRTEKGSPHD